jgi:hypothetical protein
MTSDEFRRRYPRLEFGIRVFEEKDWMIRDLSPNGCFIETASPLPVDTEVDLRFRIPLALEYVPIVARGTVRRSEPNGMAIEFIDLDTSYHHFLKQFVKAYF